MYKKKSHDQLHKRGGKRRKGGKCVHDCTIMDAGAQSPIKVGMAFQLDKKHRMIFHITWREVISWCQIKRNSY